MLKQAASQQQRRCLSLFLRRVCVRALIAFVPDELLC